MEFSMKLPLSELGQKIFLDRYSLKDPDKNFKIGDTALVIVDKKSGQREIGIVAHVAPNPSSVSIKFEGEDSPKSYPIDQCERPIETVHDMVRRVAKAVSKAEAPHEQMYWQEQFERLMNCWKFVPGGRILAGAGNPATLTLMNCFVIPSPHDSRKGIIDTFYKMTEIMSRGGGVGINISTLRPNKAFVKGVNGRSSGAVSWGGLYSYGTGLIEQGGSRRGALMLILDDWHPDILEFINCKREAGKVTNANISVALSDSFMWAVEYDNDWNLFFPKTNDEHYETEWDGDIRKWMNKGYGFNVHATIKARNIWEAIINSAWDSAEPGIWFKDRTNAMSNSYYYAPLNCTNPCAEEPLPDNGVCNLGAINLSKFIKDNHVDWDNLGDTIYSAIRFLDNVIDVTDYPFIESEIRQKTERRLGLGTMGLAEMLIQLKLRYGSQESLDFIDMLYKFIATKAYEASVLLAQEKSRFYEYEDLLLLSEYMVNMPKDIVGSVRSHGLRNVTLLTQAPNGTTATMVGVSTGIEPYFSFKWFRKSRMGMHEETMQIAQDWLNEHPGQPLPDYFVTAMQLTPEEHIKVQATIQRWIDSSISKTCNVPNSYTAEQVGELYQLAYKLGCKSTTVYRDGSRDEQVLNIAQGEECPECHNHTLIKSEGCENCSTCGYSLCTL